jgi:hypothetical protein
MKNDNKELFELAQQWTPPTPSKNSSWYSYSFQCCGCLSLHSGVIQSDTQELEIECNKLVPEEYDVLFNLLGKPRVCGKVNHVYGHKKRPRT